MISLDQGLIVEWWRLFVGNVSNDVNERTLDAAFNKYPSYVKSKVVRDRLSEKVRYTYYKSLINRPSLASSLSKTLKTF